jgi:hypothetical protein
MTILLWAASVAGQQPPTPPAKQPAKTLSSSLGVYVFPTANQSPEKQQQDEAACYAWAQSNTGFDPLAAASASAGRQSGQQQQQKGGVLRSAGSGAAMGAAIGGISGDAGEGAATGAAAGALRGKLGQRRAQKQAEQAQAQAQKQQAAGMEGFRKAFSVCMEGKGYTAK